MGMRELARRMLGLYPPLHDHARSVRAVARARRAGADRFLWFAAPGHYYSPVPDLPAALTELERRKSALGQESLPDVDLAESGQAMCWERLVPHMAELGLGRSGRSGFYPGDNVFFGLGEAQVAAAMLLRAPPARIVEIGSGFSSALLLDAAARCSGQRIDFTFVDPDVSRLSALLGEAEMRRHRVIQGLVQSQDPSMFRTLERGDWLFIDSSHVAKIGSDVLFLLFEVLPRLKPGVLVHIHDIFWPFEYPEAWYREGRAWNEAYLVRAMLGRGGRWRIRFWNDWFWRAHQDEVKRALPGTNSLGASLWLEDATA